MTTRDTLEQLLDLYNEVKQLEQMVTDMFNRVYAEHLQRQKKEESNK